MQENEFQFNLNASDDTQTEMTINLFQLIALGFILWSEMPLKGKFHNSMKLRTEKGEKNFFCMKWSDESFHDGKLIKLFMSCDSLSISQWILELSSAVMAGRFSCEKTLIFFLSFNDFLQIFTGIFLISSRVKHKNCSHG